MDSSCQEPVRVARSLGDRQENPHNAHQPAFAPPARPFNGRPGGFQEKSVRFCARCQIGGIDDYYNLTHTTVSIGDLGSTTAIPAAATSRPSGAAWPTTASTGRSWCSARPGRSWPATTPSRPRASSVSVTLLDIDDEQAKQIMLVDNRTNDLASYDDRLLSELLAELPTSPARATGPRT